MTKKAVKSTVGSCLINFNLTAEEIAREVETDVFPTSLIAPGSQETDADYSTLEHVNVSANMVFRIPT